MLAAIRGWYTATPENLLKSYVQTSNPKHLDAIVRQFNSDVYHYLCSLSDAELAKDCLQKTWLKVMNLTDKHELPNNVKGWLFVVARNVLIDEFRHNSKYQSESFNDVYTSDGTLEERICELDKLSRFNLLIETMPFVQREAFILQREEFSIEQIADITGVNYETVRSRLRYARKFLKAHLEVSNEQ